MDAFLSAFKPKNLESKKQLKNRANIPWVEKYRPKTIDEVAFQTEVVSVLQKCIDGSDLPNLLFYGPPGTGKTSLILALARQIFGPYYSERVLELNASDERGIGVVREKVKTFAHVAVSGARSDSATIPRYKLIILDEADSMTAPAQAALRRTMETETRTTRFCLTCNYVTRIIDPITSRCAKFRFRPLNNEVARARLRHISDAEKLVISDKSLDFLLLLSRGDLRVAITMLQCVSQLTFTPIDSPQSTASLEISEEQIEQVSAVIPNKLMEQLLKNAHSGNFDELQLVIKNLLLEGYAAQQAIHQLHDLILDSEDLQDAQKCLILEAIALSDSCLVEGADEYLQLMSIAASLLRIFA